MRVRGLVPLACALAAGLNAGCERTRSPRQYATLTGHVLACHTDTGELSVRVPRKQPGTPSEQPIFCVITKDSEIYVDDMFSTMAAIEVNDTIELVGYHDPDPRQERFVVSFAYVDRQLPPPPLPELPPPTTQATSQPQEE
jgi:hypothetical protein